MAKEKWQRVSRDRRRFSAAALGTSLLLAACSGSGGLAPQATATPTMPPSFAALRHPPTLRDLTGLAPTDVTALIGNPDLRRVDPPAEVWQYRNAECVLNLYFYDNGASRRLVYAETHSRLADRRPSEAAQCRQEFGPPLLPTRQTRL